MSQPPQPPYGAGNPQYYRLPPDHPQATTVLILGILGIVLCQVIAPFAWAKGNTVVREIDLAQGQIGGRGSAQAGRVCGIVGTCILGFYVLMVLFFIALAVVSPGSFDDTSGY